MASLIFLETDVGYNKRSEIALANWALHGALTQKGCMFRLHLTQVWLCSEDRFLDKICMKATEQSFPSVGPEHGMDAPRIENTISVLSLEAVKRAKI